MSTKRSVYVFLMFGAISFLSFYSSQPPTGYTASPHANTVGSCAECHSGGTFQGSLSLSIPPIVPNASHAFELTICYNPTSGVPKLGGFSMDMVNFNSGQHYGEFTPGSNTAVQDGGEYVSHDGALAFPIGETCIDYNFNWIAPNDFDYDLPLGIFAAAVLANDNGGTSGDRVLLNDFLPMLPIDLIDFTVLLDEDNRDLSWTVGHAEHIEKFIVERSENGLDFQQINIIYNERNAKEYHYADREFLNRDHIYYRLKMIEVDGKISLSNMLSVKMPNEHKLRLLENPIGIGERISIVGLDDLIDYNYKVIDISGKIIAKGRITHGEYLPKAIEKPGLFHVMLYAFERPIYSARIIAQ